MAKEKKDLEDVKTLAPAPDVAPLGEEKRSAVVELGAPANVDPPKPTKVVVPSLKSLDSQELGALAKYLQKLYKESNSALDRHNLQKWAKLVTELANK